MEQTTVDIAKAAHVLKLLGDKTRLTIIAVLKNRECCVCELVELFAMSQPSISQHLRKMKDVGLVTEERKGQWIHYSLNQGSEYYKLIEDILRHVQVEAEKVQMLESKTIKVQLDC